MKTKNARIVITGGAGFIGSNVADYYLGRANEVIIIDNLSRKGTENNIEWLKTRHQNRFNFCHCDIRDYGKLSSIIREYQPLRLFHFAAQVAVTTSVTHPRQDFETNALGTLNVLEAVREHSPHTILVYSSTNKVYGALDDIGVREIQTRYVFDDRAGIDEKTPLDFHSPYGCSKGAADQYVRDYARIYGLRTVVFRMSCIYGQRQFGNEDQGWVAHFLISWNQNRPLAIYGDGKQTRDVLWIEDLVQAFDAASCAIDVTAGQVYNIGGGSSFSLSVWEEFSKVAQPEFKHQPEVKYGPWRPGDQPIFISDIGKAHRDFGWSPSVCPSEGISRLVRWITENPRYFTNI